MMNDVVVLNSDTAGTPDFFDGIDDRFFCRIRYIK